MSTKTKRQLESENKTIRGKRPPDNDELAKNMKKAGLTGDMAGLNLNQVKTGDKEETTPPANLDETIPPGDDETNPPPPPPPREKVKLITIEEALEALGITGPPTLQQSFEAVMMAYGYSQGAARQISKHAAVTGDANVFSDPEKLLGVMNEFRGIGDPSTRKNILDYYIKFCNLKPSEGYNEKVGLQPGQVKEVEEKKKEAEKIYYFDDMTGRIRPPMKDEVGMTLEQAKYFKSIWLQDHPDSNHDDGREPKMIQDANGNWIVNPNAKNLTPGDIAYLNGLQPKPDTIDLITMGEEKRKQLQEAMGVKSGGNTDMTERLFNLQQENFKLQMAQSNTMLTDAIKAMTEVIKEVNKPKPDDPMLTAMKAQLEEQRKQNEALLKRLDDDRESRHLEEIGKLKEQIAAVAKQPMGAKNELDVLSEVGRDISGNLKQAGADLVGLLKQNPPPMMKGDREAVKEGLKNIVNNPAPNIPPKVKELAKNHWQV